MLLIHPAALDAFVVFKINYEEFPEPGWSARLIKILSFRLCVVCLFARIY